MGYLQKTSFIRKPNSGAIANPAIIRDLGMVAGYLFNENGATVYDITGNANIGTLNGTPNWTPGKFGTSINFDGSSTTRITAGTGARIADLRPMTALAWVNLGSGFSNEMIAYKNNGDASAGWVWGFDGTPKANFFCTTSANDVGAVNATIPTAGVWTQIAVSWTGVTGAATVVFYQNGVQSTSNTDSAGTGSLSSDAALVLQIGGLSAAANLSGSGVGSWLNSSATLNLTGGIDHLLLFNRVLFPIEILKLYQQPFYFMQTMQRRRGRAAIASAAARFRRGFSSIGTRGGVRQVQGV